LLFLNSYLALRFIYFPLLFNVIVIHSSTIIIISPRLIPSHNASL